MFYTISSTAAYTITLPIPGSVSEGTNVQFKKISGNHNITITTSSSSNIFIKSNNITTASNFKMSDGANSVFYCSLISNGTDRWYQIV
jgi:hypothetical protein